MPRSMQEILDQADDLAAKLEGYEPSPDDEVDVAEYLLRRAALARSRSERQVVEAVVAARRAGLSWKRIGEQIGTPPREPSSATAPSPSQPDCSTTPGASRSRALPHDQVSLPITACSPSTAATVATRDAGLEPRGVSCSGGRLGAVRLGSPGSGPPRRGTRSRSARWGSQRRECACSDRGRRVPPRPCR